MNKLELCWSSKDLVSEHIGMSTLKCGLAYFPTAGRLGLPATGKGEPATGVSAPLVWSIMNPDIDPGVTPVPVAHVKKLPIGVSNHS